MKLSKALEGFVFSRQADGISPETIRLYKICLGSLGNYLHDPDLNSISEKQLKEFFTWLRSLNKYQESTVQIYWRCIRAFYKWAEKSFEVGRPDLIIQRPRPAEKAINPYSQEEIQKLLAACDHTASSRTIKRKSFQMERPTAKRDRALVLCLLDTGLRASELCRLNIQDVHLDTGQIEIKPFRSGRKSRSRIVYIGKMARNAMWSYISKWNTPSPAQPFFSCYHRENAPLNRNSLNHLLSELGHRSGVIHCFPHRFRHTFAIQYLRNGGDIFSLQRLLGHATLEMVKHYLALADTDAERAHQRASPVDRWAL